MHSTATPERATDMVVDPDEVAELNRQLRVFRAGLMYPEQDQSKNQAHKHKDGNHSLATVEWILKLKRIVLQLLLPQFAASAEQPHTGWNQRPNHE